jgi:hypothetical protein
MTSKFLLELNLSSQSEDPDLPLNLVTVCSLPLGSSGILEGARPSLSLTQAPFSSRDAKIWKSTGSQGPKTMFKSFDPLLMKTALAYL